MLRFPAQSSQRTQPSYNQGSSLRIRCTMLPMHDIEDVLACPHTYDAVLADTELDQHEDWYRLCDGR